MYLDNRKFNSLLISIQILANEFETWFMYKLILQIYLKNFSFLKTSIQNFWNHYMQTILEPYWKQLYPICVVWWVIWQVSKN